MRISDWSSDVCSSDLKPRQRERTGMSVVGDRQAIIDAVKGRRSIRRFLPTPVADETVLEIIEIAARAPSGQNMQPWLIHFVTGETRDALRPEEHTSEL